MGHQMSKYHFLMHSRRVKGHLASTKMVQDSFNSCSIIVIQYKCICDLNFDSQIHAKV